MTTAETFHIGDVLSVATGKMLSPTGMLGIQRLIEHLAGEPIWTHQIPRVMREARPYVLATFPWLGSIDASDVTPQSFDAWLTEIVRRHGATIAIEPMPAGAHVSRDPVDELAAMREEPS